MSEAWICVQCGVQYSPSESPPIACTVCADERQFVNPGGQRWTTHDAIRSSHSNVLRSLEPCLWGISTTPRFAIGQEIHLVETAKGNVLWDCLSVIDDATMELIRARGGVSAISISHPHFYDSMVEWSRALGGPPVYLHSLDRRWAMRPDPNLVFWDGESLEIVEGVRVVRCGGHFAGAAVLHWARGADGHGVLLSSDTIQLVADPTHVTFMYSYPNLIPLPASAVEGVLRALAPLSFERVYGSFYRMLESNAKEAIERSARRYIKAVTEGLEEPAAER